MIETPNQIQPEIKPVLFSVSYLAFGALWGFADAVQVRTLVPLVKFCFYLCNEDGLMKKNEKLLTNSTKATSIGISINR